MGQDRKKVKGRKPARLDPDFARRLVDVMRDRKVRPGDLAQLIPTHPTTVSRWRGGHVPPDAQVARIADVLGTPLNWLKRGQGTMNDPVGGVGALPADGERRRGAVADSMYRLAEAANGEGRVPLEVAITAVRELAVRLGVPAGAGAGSPGPP